MHDLSCKQWVGNSMSRHRPDQRLVTVEAGCALADCLIWAAARLKGRIRAVCLEANPMVVAAGRRSVTLHGLEGQVEVLLRIVTSSPKHHQMRWTPEALHEQREHPQQCCAPCGFQEDAGIDGFPDCRSIRATSIDHEVARLGLGPVDILKIAPFPGTVDALRGAKQTLETTGAVLVARRVEPNSLNETAMMLSAAGFRHIQLPGIGGDSPYGQSIIARRPNH